MTNIILNLTMAKLAVLALSGQEQVCCTCNVKKPFLAFPPYYRYFRSGSSVMVMPWCWDCLYDTALNRLKSDANLKHNPVNAWVYAAVRKAYDNGLIVAVPCFCGEPGTHFHHWSLRRPLDVVCYCREHHNKLHACLDRILAAAGFVPEHYRTRYFLRSENGRLRVAKEEYPVGPKGIIELARSVRAWPAMPVAGML